MAEGVRTHLGGVLVFDGDCGFCTSAAKLGARLVPNVEIVPWQQAHLPALGIRPEDAADAVQWVDRSGRVFAGAEACARMLQTGALVLRLVGSVMLLPGVRKLADVVYRVVARNRHRLPGGTPACKIG